MAHVRKNGSKMVVTVESQDFQYPAMIIMKLVASYFTLIFNFFFHLVNIKQTLCPSQNICLTLKSIL